MSKFNFNIDIENDNDILTKSKSNSVLQKDLYVQHEYFVDMGLSSGILWCKYNLGVNFDNLENPKNWTGKYYAWGETKTKREYSWETYKYADTNLESHENFLKYNQIDNKEFLELKDDAAYINNPFKKYGINICMPTLKQTLELTDNSSFSYEINHNHIEELNGILLTSKINGNKLFLPICNYKSGDHISNTTEGGDTYITTRNLGSKIDNGTNKKYLIHKMFWKVSYMFGKFHRTYFSRYNGMIIRPILMK